MTEVEEDIKDIGLEFSSCEQKIIKRVALGDLEGAIEDHSDLIGISFSFHYAMMKQIKMGTSVDVIIINISEVVQRAILSHEFLIS